MNNKSNYLSDLFNQNQSQAQGGMSTTWAYHRFDSMLITYLTQKLGNLDDVKAVERETERVSLAIAAAQYVSAPIVQNVIRLYTKSDQGARQGFDQSQAA